MISVRPAAACSLQLVLHNGVRYKLYFSSAVTLRVTGVAGGGLRVDTPFTGVMRVAAISNDNLPGMAYSPAVEAIYDAHKDIYPTGR